MFEHKIVVGFFYTYALWLWKVKELFHDHMHGMTHGFFQLTSLCHCRHACNLHGTVGTLKSMFFLAASRFSLTGLKSVQCNYRLQCAVAVNVQCVSSAQKSTGPRALVLLNRHSMPTYTARTCEPVDCFLHLQGSCLLIVWRIIRCSGTLANLAKPFDCFL